MNKSANVYAVVPQTRGVGGMVTFRHKFSAGLRALGHEVHPNPLDPSVAAVLVIGGTRGLGALRRARRRGVPVVQRLNGRNWLHRRTRTGVRHYLRAEYGNLVLNLIRTRLATAVIYQSQFAKEWWERAEGQTGVPSQVIHNGVDLRTYTPRGSQKPPEDRLRVLMVEGSLAGGYEAGLASAVALAEGLQQLGQPVELQVVGHTQRADRQKWQSHSEVPIDWVGQVPRADIPSLDRGAHLLFSSDLNAACPNAVIEAMACGLPVVGFDTGALPELVPHMGGRLAGYGGDPWMLDPPDTEALVAAAVAVLKGGKTQRLTARGWAEHKFGLDDMVRDYLDVLDS